jgi:hypothetical protein
MTYLLRFFDFDKEDEPFFSSDDKYSEWLQHGDVPATAITGFSSKYLKNCEMSVFQTDGTDDSINRIIVAREAKDARLLQYSDKKQIIVLFPSEKIAELGIEIKNTSGNTADDSINQTHRILIHLSANNLVQLLSLVYSDDIKSQIVKPEDYCKNVKEYIDNGYLDINKVHTFYKKALGK